MRIYFFTGRAEESMAMRGYGMISAVLMPLAINSSTFCTGQRMPRTTALPWQMCGSVVMRERILTWVLMSLKIIGQCWSSFFTIVRSSKWQPSPQSHQTQLVQQSGICLELHDTDAHWSVHHGTSESGTLQVTRSMIRAFH